MATYYFVTNDSLGASTSEDASYDPGPDWHSATEAEYNTVLADILDDLGALGLQVTRSTVRANPVGLQDYTLDDGRAYAVFVVDNSGLNVSQVQFDLDGSPHNTEFSAPWDFNGTDVGGEALKYVFTSGVHEIDAHITHSGGVKTITATFEVD